MSVAESKLAPAAPLRVAIYTPDLPRHTALSRLVVEAGHIVVNDLNMADVVLADGDDLASIEGRLVVTLGGIDHHYPGVLPSGATARQIDAALRAVAVGLIVRSPGSENTGFDSTPESDTRTLLTPRELEVLSAIAIGDTNKAIARRLNISLHTVKFHVESLFRKLGARTRTEAVAKASERRRHETITL